MPTDRYGLSLSTQSDASATAYTEACNLLLTLYPGAGDAFDRAIEADPDFALAHAGKARLLQLSGKIPAAREALPLPPHAPPTSARPAISACFKCCSTVTPSPRSAPTPNAGPPTP